MSEWLAAGPGPDPEDVARRVAWWRARERSLAHAAPELRGALEDPVAARPPDVHAQLDAFLPRRALALDVHGLVRAWYGPALDELDVRLEDGLLERARSWLDVRAWLHDAPPLPAALVEAAGERRRSHALAFALFCPSRFGSRWGRYPELLGAAIDACRPGADDVVRAWDAGCATGEGTWELALALAERFPGRAVEVVGTTPFPLERLMAARRAWPHDPARTAAFGARLAGAPTRCRVVFAHGDLLASAPAGRFDLVTCWGVLGEAIAAPDEQRVALGRLAAAIGATGVLSLGDAFRADRSARAAALAREALSRHGCEDAGGACYRRV